MLKKFISVWLPFLLLLLFLPAALYAPDLWAKQAENQLLSTPQSRPAMEGMLSEKAQGIPLLYTLYRNRYLGNHYDTHSYNIDPEKAYVMLMDNLTALSEQQLIAPELLDFYLGISELSLSSNFASASCSDGQGIRTLSIRLQTEKCTIDVSASIYQDTDQVLNFSISNNSEFPLPAQATVIPDDFLERYRLYLGLGVLDDWKVPVSSNPDVSAIWSEEGQIYLFCSTQNEFSFGATSLSPEDFRGIEFDESNLKSVP